MNKKNIADKDINFAVSLIRKTDSYQRSVEVGRSFVAKAKKELDFLPKNKWNYILSGYADYIIERDR